MVMPADIQGKWWRMATQRWPGRLGRLIGPGWWCPGLHNGVLALDNDAYGAYANGRQWASEAWVRMLDLAAEQDNPPAWVLCPDVVGDRDATLAAWGRWYPIAAAYGWPVAFAAQDGMTPGDVPRDAALVFVGGSTEWKWSTARMWCSAFPRVHIGRAGSRKRLWMADRAGAESADSAGFFRDPQRRAELERYLDESSFGQQQPVLADWGNMVAM